MSPTVLALVLSCVLAAYAAWWLVQPRDDGGPDDWIR